MLSGWAPHTVIRLIAPWVWAWIIQSSLACSHPWRMDLMRYRHYRTRGSLQQPSHTRTNTTKGHEQEEVGLNKIRKDGYCKTRDRMRLLKPILHKYHPHIPVSFLRNAILTMITWSLVIQYGETSAWGVKETASRCGKQLQICLILSHIPPKRGGSEAWGLSVVLITSLCRC